MLRGNGRARSNINCPLSATNLRRDSKQNQNLHPDHAPRGFPTSRLGTRCGKLQLAEARSREARASKAAFPSGAWERADEWFSFWFRAMRLLLSRLALVAYSVSLFFRKTGKFTEEEFDTAHRQFKEIGKPRIYIFFKDAPVNMGAIGEEVRTLLDFKKKLADLGHFHTAYK